MNATGKGAAIAGAASAPRRPLGRLGPVVPGSRARTDGISSRLSSAGAARFPGAVSGHLLVDTGALFELLLEAGLGC